MGARAAARRSCYRATMHHRGALSLLLAIIMVTFGCDDGAQGGTGRRPTASATAPSPGSTGTQATPGKSKSPIQSDADCRKAPVCKDFGACTHKGGKCMVTSDADCAASSFCKLAGKCVAHQGKCRIGATKNDDCHKPHGTAGLNPCESKGHCVATDGICLAGKDEDCAKTQACRETGQCSAKGGLCVVGSEKDCRQSMACAKLEGCEYRPGKDGRGGICAPPAGSGAPSKHQH